LYEKNKISFLTPQTCNYCVNHHGTTLERTILTVYMVLTYESHSLISTTSIENHNIKNKLIFSYQTLNWSKYLYPLSNWS